MELNGKQAVLFDFDGVVIDTEGQYSQFWHQVGVDYLGMSENVYPYLDF